MVRATQLVEVVCHPGQIDVDQAALASRCSRRADAISLVREQARRYARPRRPRHRPRRRRRASSTARPSASCASGGSAVRARAGNRWPWARARRSATRASDSRLRPRSAPTKRATNSDAGLPRISAGGPNCASTPPTWSTATRSPILIASSMSWVTNTIVLASRLLQAQQLVLKPLADDRIDCAERLVHEHQRRIGSERTGDADTLPLAARQLCRIALAIVGPAPGRRGRAARRRARSCACVSQPSSLGTMAMLSPTVRCGIRPTCWIT